MKKIINSLLTLSLLSFNIVSCKNTNNTQYDNVKDAISSLENQTFHFPIKNVQRISFTGNDWRKKEQIGNFRDDIDTKKIWEIMTMNISNYMLTYLKNSHLWTEYLAKDISGGLSYNWNTLLEGKEFVFYLEYDHFNNDERRIDGTTHFILDFNELDNTIGFYLNYFIDENINIDGMQYVNFDYEHLLYSLKTFNSIETITKNINKMTHDKIKPNFNNISKIAYIHNNINYNSIYNYFLSLGKDKYRSGTYSFILQISFYHNEILSEQVKNEMVNIIIS